jgi:hypothetical protein
VHIESFERDSSQKRGAFQTTEAFKSCLRILKPDIVILMEPVLEYIRILEVNNSEGLSTILGKERVPPEVRIIRYGESSEMF